MHDSVSERRRLSESVRGGALAPLAKPTTVPSAVREFAAPSAHSGPVTSLSFVGEGLMLLTAGRDHRLRLWDAQTGAHMLVHYAGAFNTARHTKQLAVSSGGGGGLGCARVFFPSSDGIAVYEVLTGRKVTTLKAHLGEVTCCVASPWDARVFSGGADCTVHAWTPPPCGLAKPTPCEQPTRDTGPTGADGSVHVDDVLAPLARGAEIGSRPAVVELDDVDAWSDDEEEAPVTAPAPRARAGRGRGQGGVRKRHRSS
jgi:WD40 repeat protein